MSKQNKIPPIRISSEDHKHKCFDVIADLPIDGDYLVSFKSIKETRTSAQNRLRWLWMGFLERELAGEGVGRNKEDWNRYFKGKFLRGILISQDEEYAQFYNQADALIYDAPMKDFAKTMLLDNVRTEWLTSKNMSVFMDAIDKHCSFELRVQLPLPSDLKWLCEDGKWIR